MDARKWLWTSYALSMVLFLVFSFVEHPFRIDAPPGAGLALVACVSLVVFLFSVERIRGMNKGKPPPAGECRPPRAVLSGVVDRAALADRVRGVLGVGGPIYLARVAHVCPEDGMHHLPNVAGGGGKTYVAIAPAGRGGVCVSYATGESDGGGGKTAARDLPIERADLSGPGQWLVFDADDFYYRVSARCTACVFRDTPHKNMVKELQARISAGGRRTLPLALFSWVHTAIVLFNVSYIFVFSPSMDKHYLIFNFIMVLHWFVCNMECILSFFEKKNIDPSYRLGAAPYLHPFAKLIAVDEGAQRRNGTLASFLALAGLSVVVYRQAWMPTAFKVLTLAGLHLYTIDANTKRV